MHAQKHATNTHTPRLFGVREKGGDAGRASERLLGRPRDLQGVSGPCASIDSRIFSLVVSASFHLSNERLLGCPRHLPVNAAIRLKRVTCRRLGFSRV